MIPRPTYIEALLSWKDCDVIKVVTGVRRCGKSTLLALYADTLREQGVAPEAIISINLEQLENEHLLDYRLLHDEVLRRMRPHTMNYVLIDEVQNVPDFQRALDSLYTRSNIDLYVTGSNALLLGGTLATLLSGRFVEIAMLPLSFAEYCSAYPEVSPTRAYSTYIATGGLPVASRLEPGSLALHDYLGGILNTVLFKDVAQRLSIANSFMLDALVRFLFDNIGNLTSMKGISDAMKASGLSIAPNTVSEYLSGLVNSYIFYPARRYDVRGKRILKLEQKLYGVDMGMRSMVLGGSIRDRGRVLENIVFLELLKRTGKVYIGRIDNLEIDFVTDGPDGRWYYQVAESVHSPETLERELAPLRKLHDNHPKVLLTLDDENPTNYDGIVHMNALDWLLGRDTLAVH